MVGEDEVVVVVVVKREDELALARWMMCCNASMVGRKDGSSETGRRVTDEPV